MSLSIRIYGTVDALPDIDDLAEVLEESEFEAAVEIEDELDDETWTEIAVFEPSIQQPIPVNRHIESYLVREHVSQLRDVLSNRNGSEQVHNIVTVLDDTIVTYSIELDEDMADDDNAMLIAMLSAQFLAQRCAGVYCVDCEGFFDEMGELLYEVTT